MIRKLTLGLASLMFVAVVGFDLASTNAYAAAKRVDCSKVSSELGAGKKAKDIAKEMNISASSVYRCKKKMGVAKSAGTSASAGSTTSTAPSASSSSHKK